MAREPGERPVEERIGALDVSFGPGNEKPRNSTAIGIDATIHIAYEASDMNVSPWLAMASKVVVYREWRKRNRGARIPLQTRLRLNSKGGYENANHKRAD